MAAFLAVVLVGTAFAISTRYKRDFHEPLAKAIEARVRLLDDVTGGSTADIDSARLAFARRFNEVDEQRSEEHTSELQSLMRISYAVFCLKKKTKKNTQQQHDNLQDYTVMM